MLLKNRRTEVLKEDESKYLETHHEAELLTEVKESRKTVKRITNAQITLGILGILMVGGALYFAIWSPEMESPIKPKYIGILMTALAAVGTSLVWASKVWGTLVKKLSKRKHMKD